MDDSTRTRVIYTITAVWVINFLVAMVAPWMKLPYDSPSGVHAAFTAVIGFLLATSARKGGGGKDGDS